MNCQHTHLILHLVGNVRYRYECLACKALFSSRLELFDPESFIAVSYGSEASEHERFSQSRQPAVPR